MRLGTLELENKLLLAPMLNVSTGPYRRFCRSFHKIGLVFVPMIYTKRLSENPNFLKHELHKIEEETPIGIQLIGSDHEALKKSLVFLESFPFEVLDINAGCPSRRSIKAREGGYLLKDLELLQKLLKITLKYSSRPVSLKIRIGFDNTRNLYKLTRIIKDSGVEFLTVHARTVRARFNESMLNLGALKELKKALEIPIVGNGDIINPIIAKVFFKKTNVDAIMIGRASMGNPEIFQQIHDYISNGKIQDIKNKKELMQQRIELYEKIIDDFIDGISLTNKDKDFKFVELKRNSIWLTKNIKNSTKLRSKLSKTENLNQLRAILQDFYESQLK